MTHGISLVHLIRTWLLKSACKNTWKVVGYRPDKAALMGFLGVLHSNRGDHHSRDYLTIYSDHVEIPITYHADVRLNAADPKFFTKLKSILRALDMRKIRWLTIETKFWNNEIDKINNIISKA